MVKVNKNQAYSIGKLLNIDFRKYPLKLWMKAMNIELEHGSKMGSLTNVTNNNLLKTGQIALAHILEYPDYYERLIKMEKDAHKYWYK